MENTKQKFIDLAYSKFGIKANGKITFEQAFEIIDELELTIPDVVKRSEPLICPECNCNAAYWNPLEEYYECFCGHRFNAV